VKGLHKGSPKSSHATGLHAVRPISTLFGAAAINGRNQFHWFWYHIYKRTFYFGDGSQPIWRFWPARSQHTLQFTAHENEKKTRLQKVRCRPQTQLNRGDVCVSA